MNIKRTIATLYLSVFCLLPSSPGIQQVVYAQPNHAVAIDAFGDIHVAGVFFRSITLSDTTLYASGGELGTAFIARFDADGALLSVRQVGAGAMSPEGIVALVTDDAGHGYVGGVFPDSVQLEPGLWGRGHYVATYDRDGSFQWVNTNLRMLIMDLAIDEKDQVHVLGLDFLEPLGYVAAKLDTAGNFVWHKEKILGRGSLGVALALGADDQAMLTGLVDDDVFATRLDQDGNETWFYRTATGGRWGAGIGTDALGNSYIAGARHIDTLRWSDSYVLTEGSHYIAKLNPDGEPMWANAITDLQGDGENHLALVVDQASRTHLAIVASAHNGEGRDGLFLTGYDAEGHRIYACFLEGVYVYPDARNFLAVNGDALYIVGAVDDPAALPDITLLYYDPVEHYFLGRLALSRIVSREEEEAPLPAKGFLVVYPNPFRGSAMIQYKLSEAAFVDIRVYDVLGRNVAVLAQQRQHAGEHRIVFKTKDLISGTYFLHLRAGTRVQTRSITLLR